MSVDSAKQRVESGLLGLENESAWDCGTERGPKLGGVSRVQLVTAARSQNVLRGVPGSAGGLANWVLSFWGPTNLGTGVL